MSNRIPKSKLFFFDTAEETSLRRLAEAAFDQVSLDALTDVVVSNPNDGEILQYNDILMAWENVPLPNQQVANLDDIGDVTITAVADEDVLTYDAGTGRWTNAPASGGPGATSLDDLTDVTLSTLVDEEVLSYDSVSGQWINIGVDKVVNLAGTTGDIQYRGTDGYFAATSGFNYTTGTNTLTVDNIRSNQYLNTGTATTIFGTGNASPVQMVTEFSGTVGVLDLIANNSTGTAVAELRLRSNQTAPLFWDGTTQSTVLHSGNVKTVGGESILGSGDIPVGSGGPVDAEDVTYDNTASGLSATDVQAAIDELAGSSVVIPDSQIVSALGNSFALKIDPQLYSPSGNFFDVKNEVASARSAHSRAFRGMSGGKWYFEVFVSGATSAQTRIGVVRPGTGANSVNVGDDGSGAGQSWAFLGDGRRGSGSFVSYGPAFGSGAVIMVACDMTPAPGSRKIWWGVNGTWASSGDPAAGTNEAFATLQEIVAPGVSPGPATCTLTLRLRSSEFSYTPPSGFSPWVT
jgi:hypothetical protein